MLGGKSPGDLSSNNNKKTSENISQDVSELDDDIPF